MAKKNKSSNVDDVFISAPEPMQYNYGYKTSRDRVKYIKRIEKATRSSIEYRDYIQFLKDNFGMDACAFFNNINKDNGKGIRIEIHHEPLCLFDIVDIVITKYEEEGIPLNDLMIASEVMELHYGNMVGLIPLSKTLHQVVGNSDKLVIPTYMIYGNYKKFVEEYGEYMGDYITKIEDAIKRTKELRQGDFDILEKKYTYLHVDGFSIPAKLETDIKESNVDKNEIVVIDDSNVA